MIFFLSKSYIYYFKSDDFFYLERVQYIFLYESQIVQTQDLLHFLSPLKRPKCVHCTYCIHFARLKLVISLDLKTFIYTVQREGHIKTDTYLVNSLFKPITPMYEKSCPILLSKYKMKIGQDFLAYSNDQLTTTDIKT